MDCLKDTHTYTLIQKHAQTKAEQSRSSVCFLISADIRVRVNLLCQTWLIKPCISAQKITPLHLASEILFWSGLKGKWKTKSKTKVKEHTHSSKGHCKVTLCHAKREEIMWILCLCVCVCVCVYVCVFVCISEYYVTSY